jgi:protein-disulfide isomerase
MRINWLALTVVIVPSLLMAAATPTAPALDKAQLEQYLRYAEGFTQDVHCKLDEPQPSPFPGFYRLAVHWATDAGGRADRVYYLTPDGQKLINASLWDQNLNGSLWDLKMSPFAEALSHMPESGYGFGPEDAKVKLVIFSDFQCPYCREFAKVVRDNVTQKYPKDVSVLFEDFPIDNLHPWARAAAEASHCVGDQKPAAFWLFHDWVFEHQAEIKKENLREKVLGFAKDQNKDQNLDAAKLQACMDTHADAAAVEANLAAGAQLQVRQTPTFFINGRMVPGALKWPSLDIVIQLELHRPASIPDGKKADCCQVFPPVVGKK